MEVDVTCGLHVVQAHPCTGYLIACVDVPTVDFCISSAAEKKSTTGAHCGLDVLSEIK